MAHLTAVFFSNGNSGCKSRTICTCTVAYLEVVVPMSRIWHPGFPVCIPSQPWQVRKPIIFQTQREWCSFSIEDVHTHQSFLEFWKTKLIVRTFKRKRRKKQQRPSPHFSSFINMFGKSPTYQLYIIRLNKNENKHRFGAYRKEPQLFWCWKVMGERKREREGCLGGQGMSLGQEKKVLGSPLLLNLSPLGQTGKMIRIY